MSNIVHGLSPFKRLFRTCWKILQVFVLLCSQPRKRNRDKTYVYYGGARAGDLGGPLVKVKRLSEHFPANNNSFHLAYLLSNTPYLSRLALNILRKRGKPIVLNQNGVFYPGWYGGDWESMNAEMAIAYHEADFVFWQSAFCRRAADKFLGRRQGAGEVLYNAVDTKNKFRPISKRDPRPFTFLVSGIVDSHLEYKISSVIQGLSIARSRGLDCELLISGKVNRSVIRSCLSMAHDLEIISKINFTGQYSQEDAPLVYLRADAYVAMKYLDPCPNSVIEAMACGLPVVYSASGGIPELVGPLAGIGIPVPENWYGEAMVPDKEDIGSAMLKVANAKSPMHINARKRAEKNFEISDWIEKHRDVFCKLIG